MKYFSFKELSKSDTAIRYGIDNTPDEESKKNLELLVENILDPLREKYGKPILVNSGYRCDKVNILCKGSKTSQHKTGHAVDIQTIGDKDNSMLFELCKEFDYDQLIWEYGDDEKPDWVHISYSYGKNRHQILRAIINKEGKTIYERAK